MTTPHEWLMERGFAVRHGEPYSWTEPRPGDLFSSSAMIEASSEGDLVMLRWLDEETRKAGGEAARESLFQPDRNGNTCVFWGT